MKLIPSDPDIQTIVARIGSGDLDLQPDFQRGEVWPLSKKRRLVDSILRDWHVPPIHVVVEPSGKQVVLDGQQRLASIRDFVLDHFAVDGSIEPIDERIVSLDGLKYSELPHETRRTFNQFTIRIFRLTDYAPQEPGELFYRLNQMTYLTAAEQRNAFFGPVRQQIKSLVHQADSSNWSTLVGFSNRRMAYDDVFAKVLCTFEARTLAKRITASDISSRFRSSDPFPEVYVDVLESSTFILTGMFTRGEQYGRLNKATLFSWLVFASHFATDDSILSDWQSSLSGFWDYFERSRAAANTGRLLSAFDEEDAESVPDDGRPRRVVADNDTQDAVIEYSREYPDVLMDTFIDRSTSRVSDISSVVLRDLIIWLFFAEFAGDILRGVLSQEKQAMLRDAKAELLKNVSVSPRVALEDSVDLYAWGRLDEVSRGR